MFDTSLCSGEASFIGDRMEAMSLFSFVPRREESPRWPERKATISKCRVWLAAEGEFP